MIHTEQMQYSTMVYCLLQAFQDCPYVYVTDSQSHLAHAHY